MPRRSDALLLADMLRAIDEIETFVRGMDARALADDRRTFHAVRRCLEILGEAASRLSTEVTAAAPELPWPQLRGLRNRIVHAYFDVDVEIVHRICSAELAPLRSTLTELIAGLRSRRS